MSQGGRPRASAPQGPGSVPTTGITLARVKGQLTLEGPEGDRTFVFKLYVPDPGQSSRYMITADPFELDEDVWAERARKLVNKESREGRGRALFCVDRVEDLVIAAIAFHYEGPADPLLVRAIAERRDANELASEGCVHALKRCLHLFSLSLGGPGSLLYDAPSGAQEARARSPYEFKDAPRGLARQPGGRLLMQPPPDD
jgi:hypothetical protein